MKNTENLMKHFASVLRGRAIGTQKAPSISSTVAKYFSRKELIEIIKNRFGGAIPKEHNLVEMENSELLQLIGDELFIISYMTGKWSMEISIDMSADKKEKLQTSGELSQVIKKETPTPNPKASTRSSIAKDKKDKQEL